MDRNHNIVEVDLKKFSGLLEAINEMNLEFKGNQICLNSTEDDADNYHLGCGSLYYDWSTAKYENGELVSLDKFKNCLKESDFSVLCPIFHGTIFEKLYKEIKSKYEIGRVRIMRLTPGRVMSWHQDDSPRIHYPFKTQEGCMMVFDNDCKHLKQNQWYYTDTRKRHTAFNASRENRYHIVAVITDDLEKEN